MEASREAKAVMCLHDQPSRARGRHDEVWDGAKAEEHETAVLCGQAAEGDVWEVADEVQVAYDGQDRRRRDMVRSLLLFVAATMASGGEVQ